MNAEPTGGDELLSAAETVYDGWYAGGSRIDWEDFVDRLEDHSGVDLGCDMSSARIRAVTHHIAAYRNQ